MPSDNVRDYTCSINGCPRPGYARGWCSPHYDRNRKYGSPLAGIPVVGMDLQAKVRHYVSEDASGCWLWTGGLGQGGYGQATHEGRNVRAHRLAYEAFVGPIPVGLQLDHLCRVRACVRPEHLEPVSAAENTRRGWAARGLPEVCGNGHAWAENEQVTPGRPRQCRACNTDRARRRRERLSPR